MGDPSPPLSCVKPSVEILMPRQAQNVSLSRLYSPKDRIEARRGEDLPHLFLDLLRAFTAGEPVDPIEVVPFRDGYYILNGVRRAVVARAAGVSTIRAVVIPENVVGKVLGQAFPLAEVAFPAFGKQ